MFKDVDTDDLNLWYLDAVGTDKSDGTDKVKIELLDSGVNYSKDINVESRVNLIDGENYNPLYEDFSGHGTSMASVICSKDNGINTTGINPNVKLYSVRALDDDTKAPLSRIIEGIQWGIDNKVDIINMSFGTNKNSAALRSIIRQADEAGILLVAATGNDPTKGVQYPAAYPEVLAVGSMNAESGISDFASVGEELDVVAPGEGIETAGIFGTINGVSGSSVSTAEVSAIASKILEKDKSKTPEFVRDLIIPSSKRIKDDGTITGAADCDYALEIYDEFEASYQPGESTSVYANPNETETYDTEGVVEGLWKQKQHETLANQAFENYLSKNKLDIIVAAARGTDSKDELKNAHAFHGTGNYVVNFYIVWKFITELRKETQTIDKSLKTIRIIINKTNELTSNKLSDKEENALNTMYNALEGLERIVLIKEKEKLFSAKAATQYKAMGVAIHLIGDVFAHRTMVPTDCTRGILLENNEKGEFFKN